MSTSKLINREQELQAIDGALETLLDTKRLLRTPIVEFYGVEGIGKTVLLEEVSRRCERKHLIPIRLDKDSIGNIEENFIQPTRQLLEQEKKGVVIVDAVDDLQDEQLQAFEEGLQLLIENRFLFVVLTSKSEQKFETYRSITRKLTSFHLQPLRQADCRKYFHKFQGLKPEFRDVIYEWTRGYPFAMDVMANAIISQELNPSKAEDRQALLALLKEQVINQKLLVKATPEDHPRLETLLTLLSVPRRFNLAVMQDIVEEFAPLYKKENALEYIALPHEINAVTPVLAWNLSRAGYCIEEPVRNVFLLQLKFTGLPVAQGQTCTYQEIHRFLANMNETLANEVLGPDHIRYLEEWFYHLLESGETPHSVMQKMTATVERLAEARSVDLLIQLHEELKEDQHLKHALGQSAQRILHLMDGHLERLKTQSQTGPE